MRVLQLSCYHEKLGGAEVYFHMLVDELRKRGHEVATFGGSEEQDVDEPHRRIVKRPAYSADRLVCEAELCAEFLRFGAAFRPDVIHVHNLYAFPAEFPLALAQLGVPLVQTVHDFNLLCPNSWCVWADGTLCEGGPGEKCFQHDCVKNYPFDGRVVTGAMLRHRVVKDCFDHFLAPSQYLAERLRAHDFQNVEQLPYMVDLEGLGNPTQGELSAERDPLQLVFIGRLVIEKGVNYLIEAMAEVRRAVPGARLSIVGGGPERENLEALAAKLGLQDTVSFEGKVPHEEVRRHFLTAAAQVLPSIWCENSPVACYESYVFGLPMVASRIAGLPTMVVEGETGLLAEPRDAVDLARQLIRLLREPELQARLSRGCREALERYSKDGHMRRMEALYQDLIAKPRRAAATMGRGVSDPDVLAALDALMRQVGEVERWALSMRSHIEYLEETGQAGQPVQKFGRHLVRILKQKLK